MNLEALRVFVTLLERQSISATASALALSRSTVSKRVDELEAEAGLALIVRTSAGISPTAAGLQLAQEGRRVIGAADALLGSIRRIGKEAAGTVRVIAPIGFPAATFSRIAQIVRTRWPSVALDIRVSADPVGDLLSNGDLAFTLQQTLPPGPWEVHRVLTANEHLVAHPDYLASHTPIETLEQLQDHALLIWRCPEMPSPGDLPLTNGDSLRIEPAIVTNDHGALRHAVAMKQGIAFVPHAAVDPRYFEDSPVDVVLGDQVCRPRSLRVVFPTGSARTPRVAAFQEALRTYIRLAVATGTPPEPGVDPNQALRDAPDG